MPHVTHQFDDGFATRGMGRRRGSEGEGEGEGEGDLSRPTGGRYEFLTFLLDAWHNEEITAAQQAGERDSSATITSEEGSEKAKGLQLKLKGNSSVILSVKKAMVTKRKRKRSGRQLRSRTSRLWWMVAGEERQWRTPLCPACCRHEWVHRAIFWEKMSSSTRS